ncbi:GtrA family protein [Microcystis elabens FACHB-917]|nr:GtrA family protein [Microcystis elabens FACHB-917]
MPEPPSAPVGRRRRFLLFGAVNVAITNACLQLLLSLAPIGLATFCSQVVNFSLGYVLYGKGVFRVDRMGRRSAAAYGLVSILLWGVNWGGIALLSGLGLSSKLAALLLVPILPLISYALQLRFVFPRGRQPTEGAAR